jgi:hypothetical protein
LVPNINKLIELLDNEVISYQPLRSSNEEIGITVEMFNTDYLDSNTVNPTLNRLILTTYKIGNIGGYSVKIINPELLAIMKLELGRDKDIKDGFTLIQSSILNKSDYLKYVEMLKNSLIDYESIKGYAMMFNVK